MATVTASIEVESTLLAAYDELARTAGRSRDQLLGEALRLFLAWEQEHQTRLEQAIAQADHGDFADDTAQQAWKDKLFARAGISPEERAAFAREAERDLRQAYGLPACE